MTVCRKILMISEIDISPKKLFLDQIPKLAKGFIRLGHDARLLSYTGIMAQLSPFKSRKINHRFYKEKTDEAVCKYAKEFQPDMVYIGFARGLDSQTVRQLRAALPLAVFFAWDGDPWPSNNTGRVELGCEMDVLFATNNGEFIQEYEKAGAKKCLFMPNLIDPDNDYRYKVNEKWRSNVLWTGKIQHSLGIKAGENDRQAVVQHIAELPDVKIFGCLDFPKISGIDYLYAISGARIGVSINAINNVSLYHSDRFTHYSACGSLVLAKRVPDTEQLMEDHKHVRYFDTEEECIELINWYLEHEKERQIIADAGMAHCHDNYNAQQIAKYILDALDKGEYEAPWGGFG